MRPAVVLVALTAAPSPAQGQAVPPLTGGPLHPFIAPPGGLEPDFLGKSILTWDDLGDPACPRRGTLTIEVAQNGESNGYWPLKSSTAVLQGTGAFERTV